LKAEYSSARRDCVKIAAEIVRAAGRGMVKTTIMYSARLNHRQVTRYLGALTHEGLLQKNFRGTTYSSTSRGKAFVDTYDEVESLGAALEEKKKALLPFFRADFLQTRAPTGSPASIRLETGDGLATSAPPVAGPRQIPMPAFRRRPSASVLLPPT